MQSISQVVSAIETKLDAMRQAQEEDGYIRRAMSSNASTANWPQQVCLIAWCSNHMSMQMASDRRILSMFVLGMMPCEHIQPILCFTHAGGSAGSGSCCRPRRLHPLERHRAGDHTQL